MLLYFRNSHYRFSRTAWRYWFILIVFLDSTYSHEIFQSLITINDPGTQFFPSNTAAQLLSTILATSLKMCTMACNTNVLCRIFDFGVNLPQECRLFEGDVMTTGAIVPSPSIESRVGVVQLSANLFVEYDLPCSSVCQQSRYLTCINSTCQCMPHTYWDGSICAAQTPVLGAACQQNMNMCREDLNYTCLQFNQCGPLSVLSGTTIADQFTAIAGSVSAGLSLPLKIIADAPVLGSILVADGNKNQVVRFLDGNSSTSNGSVIARNWTGRNSLYRSHDMFFDATGGDNLYVSDSGNNRVMLFTGMQSVSPPPEVIAGTGIDGAGANQFSKPLGIVVDRQGNAVIADHDNHRVMLYAPNATSGIMIIGTGAAGNDSQSLNYPIGLFLDELHSWLYVADAFNHRIQRFLLNGSSSLDGTTVAGGNGAGSGNHQLNEPADMWVSTKTGAVYIADSNNNRVQRWSPGATTGVTYAGDPSGTQGTNATMLRTPKRVTGNRNETMLYVSDGSNKRVQRFQLI